MNGAPYVEMWKVILTQIIQWIETAIVFFFEKSKITDDSGRKLTSHKGSKIKSYTMSFKQTVAKFTKENSINLPSLKFNVDHKRIAECMNNSNEISTKKNNNWKATWLRWTKVIIEIEENLVEWNHKWRSKILHVSTKMIRIKPKQCLTRKLIYWNIYCKYWWDTKFHEKTSLMQVNIYFIALILIRWKNFH